MNKVFSILLIMALIMASLPAYHPADSNQDRRVDLKDTIIRLKELAQSADDHGTFAVQLKKAMAALAMVSGTTSMVHTDKAVDFQSITPQMEVTCLFEHIPAAAHARLMGDQPCFSPQTKSFIIPIDPRPPCCFS